MNLFKWIFDGIIYKPLVEIQPQYEIYNYEEIKNKKFALHNELVHQVLIKKIAKEIVDNIIKDVLDSKNNTL